MQPQDAASPNFHIIDEKVSLYIRLSRLNYSTVHYEILHTRCQGYKKEHKLIFVTITIIIAGKNRRAKLVKSNPNITCVIFFTGIKMQY